MWAIRNASKYLFGSPQTPESILEIPQGQLYLVRPLSPKGYSELIFRDATCSIRRTGQQFQYQLVVQRVFEEGEQELLEDEAGEDSEIAGLGNSEKDEKTFLLDEALQFRADQRDGAEHVFAWRDLSGDPGDLFEFVCDIGVEANRVAEFSIVAAECQFERKYRKSHEEATEEDLQEFRFDEHPIPSASATPSVTKGRSPVQTPSRVESSYDMAGSAKAPAIPAAVVEKAAQTIVPPAVKQPKVVETLAKEKAELHLFDFESGTFVLQDQEIEATVTGVGNWNYWLQITSSKRDWLGQGVVADLNPVFNFEYLSFIFNHYTEDGSAFSWLLRFKEQPTLESFQQGLMQALWEHLNQAKWAKVKDQDQEYVMEAFQDLTMEDAPADEEEEEDASEDDKALTHRNDQESEDEDDEDEVKTKEKDANTNSKLAVGFKNDRSYVIRGDKIGVFKHNTDNSLEFATSINRVATPKGKRFSPKKVMLHAEDRDLILQNGDNPNSLFRMDLEYGKVVDEWKIHDDIPVTSFAPERKYAQMTSEPTLIGLSGNALYRIDPRLSGAKLVDSELKQYASANKFSAAATTQNGYIAVGSEKGDVRMFDRLGIIAKTHIPALGDPITGLDVSADGRWVLATTRTYLLLIDAMQKEGPDAGKLGFEKRFSKDTKPQPRRLGLSPAHVAQIQYESNQNLNFKQAHFNTGEGENETTIVTATGPFVVTWSMKKILKGQKDPYNIKRYTEEVRADNFRYGSDKNMIVALPNEVGMISKTQLRRPNRDSIAGTPTRRSTGIRGSLATPSRRTGLSRSEVVDSPY